MDRCRNKSRIHKGKYKKTKIIKRISAKRSG